MLLITRINSFRAVSTEEILVEFQSGMHFQYGNADFLCTTWIDCGFIDDNVALLEHPAYGLTGSFQRSKVWVLVLVNRGGYGNDVAVAISIRGNVFITGHKQ
jgi:hypothetical protein